LELYLDLDPADAAALLKVSKIKFVAEEPLGLTEYCTDHIGLLDDTIGLKPRFDHVFGGARIDVHVVYLFMS